MQAQDEHIISSTLERCETQTNQTSEVCITDLSIEQTGKPRDKEYPLPSAMGERVHARRGNVTGKQCKHQEAYVRLGNIDSIPTAAIPIMGLRGDSPT